MLEPRFVSMAKQRLPSRDEWEASTFVEYQHPRHPTTCRKCDQPAEYITVEPDAGWELAHIECPACGVYFVGDEEE